MPSRNTPPALLAVLVGALSLPACQARSSGGVLVTIDPPSVALAPNGTEQFQAAATGLGSATPVIDWAASAGTVTPVLALTAAYTAPSAPGRYTVSARERSSGQTGEAIVTVVGISLSPAIISLAPGGVQQFTATVTGLSSPVIDWTASGGTISATGAYTAPAAPGDYVVTATERSTGVHAQATVTVSTTCWSLLAVNRARFYPRGGAESAMLNGTIQGSNESETNGFTVLATIAAAPPASAWTELTFTNTTPYRYVKYYGPTGSYGQIAELELYAGQARLAGAGFGTAGSRSGNPWQNALDGDTATFFDANTPSDAYVGLDLAAGHVVATPVISPAGGTFTTAQTVTITAAAGATIRYTLDGSDPSGAAALTYTAPFQVAATTTVRALARASCMAPSAGALALFTISGGGQPSPGAPATLHVGNSLTDTIDSGYLQAVAAAGGVNLDYARYTVPGAGTWLYHDDPTGGSGVANVQTYVATHPLTDITFQPFPNLPCLPYGGDATPGQNASDATNMDQAWDTAVTVNSTVQMWVYEAWPPTPTEGFSNCITGGGWLRDTSIWSTTAPATWEEAEAHELLYMESVRSHLASMNASRPPPYIVPAGRAIALLKQRVEAGQIPGVATNAFWTTYFSNNGTDNHLNPPGRYLVSLVFYTALFRLDPRLLADTSLGTGATGITAAQAAAYQQIAWDAVTGYTLSGWNRP